MRAIYPIPIITGNSPNLDILAQATADAYIAYAKTTDSPQKTLDEIIERLKSGKNKSDV